MISFPNLVPIGRQIRPSVLCEQIGPCFGPNWVKKLMVDTCAHSIVKQFKKRVYVGYARDEKSKSFSIVQYDITADFFFLPKD